MTYSVLYLYINRHAQTQCLHDEFSSFCTCDEFHVYFPSIFRIINRVIYFGISHQVFPYRTSRIVQEPFHEEEASGAPGVYLVIWSSV